MYQYFPILQPVFVLLYVLFGCFCLLLAARPDLSNFFRAPGASRVRIFLALLPVAGAALLLARFIHNDATLLLAAIAVGATIFAVRHKAWKAPRTLVA